MTVADALVGADWDVKFYARDAGVALPRAPDDAEWQRVLASAPLLQGRMPRLDFDWGFESPGPDVPEDRFVVVATTEVEVGEEGGEYRLTAKAGGGVRVLLDGAVILDGWRPAAPRAVSASVVLSPGKHRLRVEYFKHESVAELRFEMARTGLERSSCGADVIVTFNLTDFPASELTPHGVEAVHPDEFVLRLLDGEPRVTCEAVRQQRLALRKPSKTVDEFLPVLEQCGMPRTVAALRSLAGEL